MYGILRIKEAYIADSYLENLNSDKTTLKSALTNCAALTGLILMFISIL